LVEVLTARRLLLCAVLLLLGASPVAAGGPATLAVHPLGPPEPVFLWRGMRCATWDVPDTPARAWRDAGGTVHLLASHSTNRAMLGPDLDHLHHDCRIVFEGAGADAPERYDDRSWIASPYTNDGTTVFALVHNEFHGDLRPALCPARDYLSCWSNSVTLAVSHDGGASFTHAPPPAQLVAVPPYRYAGDRGRRSGYFNPSNIIRRDGFYYAFFWAEAEGAQRRGACLMRTADLADPAAWRGWDGSDFRARFIDPYRDASEPATHVCAPVGEGALSGLVTSVTLHRPSGLYIALMATERAPAPGTPPVTGLFATTSPDLLHWSMPTLLWHAGLLFKFDCADRDIVFYPTLLDPASPSRNFEEVGDRAALYLTRFNLDACRLGADRDLIRIPVELRQIGAAETRHPA
jgi:hypothetical protein